MGASPCSPPRGATSARPTRRPTRSSGTGARPGSGRPGSYSASAPSGRSVPRAAPLAPLAPLACHVPSTRGRCGAWPQRRARRVPRVPHVASRRTSKHGQERHPRPHPLLVRASLRCLGAGVLGPRPLTLAVRSGRPRCSGARACPPASRAPASPNPLVARAALHESSPARSRESSTSPYSLRGPRRGHLLWARCRGPLRTCGARDLAARSRLVLGRTALNGRPVLSPSGRPGSLR